ncbi:MAG: AAA family ATPase [Spirulinaceae cyanobacterium]
MITEVTLENFKSHRHTHLKFDDSRLHAIVGQNSSGKTSVLQAIRCLGVASLELDEDFFRNQQSIISFEKTKQSVVIGGEWHEQKRHIWIAQYTLEIKQDGIELTSSWNIDNQTSISPAGKQNGKTLYSYRLVNESSRGKTYKRRERDILDDLKSVSVLKLIPHEMSSASYSEDVIPNLFSNGNGLASILDFTRDEDYDAFKEIERMLKSVVPEVKKLGIRRAKVEKHRQRSIQLDDGTKVPYQEQQELIGKEVVLDMKSGDRIPGHALSEGTILTLGLLTVLMSPQRPNLILLDDIQQGLHPKAQLELMTVIKEIIQENPELQIIFTTHSPYILDELKPSQVHVLNTDEKGYTLSKRLDEHPDIEWAMKTLTTGEMWDAEGEEWVRADETQAVESETTVEGEKAAAS